MVNHVISRRPEYFPEPDKFIPERWLTRHQEDMEFAKHLQPPRFSSFPFSHGPRMCVGRRFADLEMQIALIQVSIFLERSIFIIIPVRIGGQALNLKLHTKFNILTRNTHLMYNAYVNIHICYGQQIRLYKPVMQWSKKPGDEVGFSITLFLYNKMTREFNTTLSPTITPS